MRILLDTSVLVAAMVEAHPFHEKGLAWLERSTNGTDAGVVGAHSLAELYSILTTLPVQPRITPVEAKSLIQHNIVQKLEIVALDSGDYAHLIEDLAKIGIVGGATYDALVLRSAEKAKVDLVVTFNEKDFRRVNPELAEKIVAP